MVLCTACFTQFIHEDKTYKKATMAKGLFSFSACVNLDLPFAAATLLLSREYFKHIKINIHMDEIKRIVVCSLGMNTCRDEGMKE